MTLFHGLSAFPITPADADGKVDTDGLCTLVTQLTTANVHSVGLLGSTGTYAFLNRAERKRAITAAAACTAGKTPLIVGIGALRTDDAVHHANDAQAAGADALLLAPVSYTPLTQDEVYAHYRTVAAATDLPLCIYNNPGTTHFTFNMTLLERLAKLPTIRAVKMPLPADGDMSSNLKQLRNTLPADFAIGYSGDWGCAEALLAGADTWYSVIGGTLPAPAMRLATAAMAGQVDESARINATLAPLWTLFQEFGSLRVVHKIAHHLGLTQAQPPLPILPMPDSADNRLTQALDATKAIAN